MRSDTLVAFFLTWKWCETMVFKQLIIIQAAVAGQTFISSQNCLVPWPAGWDVARPVSTLIPRSVLFCFLLIPPNKTRRLELKCLSACCCCFFPPSHFSFISFFKLHLKTPFSNRVICYIINYFLLFDIALTDNWKMCVFLCVCLCVCVVESCVNLSILGGWHQWAKNKSGSQVRGRLY